MLVNFEVENFLSFYKKNNFSMLAGKGTRLRNHVISYGKYNLLKSSFVFGSNASGKTNFIKAFAFLKDVILNGFENSKIERKFFRISNTAYKENARFFISFIKEEKMYDYEITFSYSKRIIISEKLNMRINTRQVNLFDRKLEEGTIIISTDYKFENDDDKSRFNVYVKDFALAENKKLQQTFFLSDVANRCSSNSQYFKCFIDVFDWFSHVLIMFPNTKFGNINQIIESEKKETFQNLLKGLDTGIMNISNKNLDFEKLFEDMSDEESKMIRDKLLNELDEHPIMLRVENAIVNLVKDEAGVIHMTQMQLNHGNSEELFDLMDESDGTRRLFDLLPLVMALNNSTLVLIDEIDRSLHTKLVRKLVELFFENNKENKTQLIVTSHDVNLLDLNLLRQDEIWFLNKINSSESHIFSLKEFNVRFDKKLIKEYLEGTFGGIPKFIKI